MIQDLVDQQSLVDTLRDLRQLGGLFGLRLQRLGELPQGFPELRELVGCSGWDADIELALPKGFCGLSINGYPIDAQHTSDGQSFKPVVFRILAQPTDSAQKIRASE